jgi:hypothetical protein
MKKIIITFDFEKNVNVFAENGQNLIKIVILTSTPGANVMITTYFRRFSPSFAK